MTTRNQGLLSASDIHGAWAIMPTPAKDGAEDWRAQNTVDLDEVERAVNGLIDAGIDGILTLGTLGECATLTWPEKQAYMQTLVETVGGRVPLFCGTTALNTRDTIEQTRYACDLGIDGTMLGLPMWCAPSVEVAVQFYRDVTEAVPEMNICVYANPEAFKFEFPRPFWAQLGTIRQVVTAKYIGIGALLADINLSQQNIKLLPLDFDYYAAARMEPDFVDGFWTSGAVCGPSVATHLRDLIASAKQSGDWSAAKAFNGRLGPTARPLFPNGSFKDFSMYNIGLEKARMDAAGWMKAGPIRPPYHLVPEAYLEGARASGQMWAELHRELTAKQAA
ncbi:MAG: dihydrodipicolinate synthase family protein [Gammaproteobacteria bacterium]|jgi:dihydrodipicolinate synthase/N-acetylneuraminate lyase